MADTQQFRIALDDALTHLEEFGLEYPLRLETDISSELQERVVIDVYLGRFHIAIFYFDFSVNRWYIQRNQQLPLSFATLPEAIAQVKSDYATLFKDLTNWRVHGRDWKRQA